jgi:hypothetical protein
MSDAARQFLTLLVTVTDPLSCERELERRKAELRAGWSRVPGMRTACLALLPAMGHAPCALLLESSYVGDLSGFASNSWRIMGAELSAIFQHCEGYSSRAGPAELASFLRARARRATPLSGGRPGDSDVHPYRVAWRRVAQIFSAAELVWARQASPSPALDQPALERRSAAVGFQESEPGVPLLHVAEISPCASARRRLTRALRAIDGRNVIDEAGARFLRDRERLVFLAYPTERAARFSERMSQEAGPLLGRIWAQTCGFPYVGPLVRRALRRRRIERFLLAERVPVAVWFNAG